jgi:hypothetical protein
MRRGDIYRTIPQRVIGPGGRVNKRVNVPGPLFYWYGTRRWLDHGSTSVHSEATMEKLVYRRVFCKAHEIRRLDLSTLWADLHVC